LFVGLCFIYQPPFTKVAKVGKLLTLANFLDSGNFQHQQEQSNASFSEANLLNFGFIIRQLPP
jgi:hypothetical protein